MSGENGKLGLNFSEEPGRFGTFLGEFRSGALRRKAPWRADGNPLSNLLFSLPALQRGRQTLDLPAEQALHSFAWCQQSKFRKVGVQTLVCQQSQLCTPLLGGNVLGKRG